MSSILEIALAIVGPSFVQEKRKRGHKAAGKLPASGSVRDMV